jgi:hypothetical protein
MESKIEIVNPTADACFVFEINLAMWDLGCTDMSSSSSFSAANFVAKAASKA